MARQQLWRGLHALIILLLHDKVQQEDVPLFCLSSIRPSHPRMVLFFRFSYHRYHRLLYFNLPPPSRPTKFISVW